MDSIQPPEPLTQAAIKMKMLRDTNLWQGKAFQVYALPQCGSLF
ncbi:hypothetical protein AVDCRST_MAG92-1977 [uncultured Coleofasciculus sp.]|uniref:Uncharacterized protein n=1 Tax=uncultured Coleofasciculus sp. TaxID=1267456 RepID=A0A6J4IHR4_9CYAN|nr:hypothetical protein AVDCRST_MAG92-1977 [uncultured Coleofasciculus sp.]